MRRVLGGKIDDPARIVIPRRANSAPRGISRQVASRKWQVARIGRDQYIGCRVRAGCSLRPLRPCGEVVTCCGEGKRLTQKAQRDAEFAEEATMAIVAGSPA